MNPTEVASQKKYCLTIPGGTTKGKNHEDVEITQNYILKHMTIENGFKL